MGGLFRGARDAQAPLARLPPPLPGRCPLSVTGLFPTFGVYGPDKASEPLSERYTLGDDREWRFTASTAFEKGAS